MRNSYSWSGGLVLAGVSAKGFKQDKNAEKKPNKKNDIATFVLISIASLVFTAGSICLLVDVAFVCWILWTVGKWLWLNIKNILNTTNININ